MPRSASDRQVRDIDEPLPVASAAGVRGDLPDYLFRAMDGAGILIVVADDQGRIRFTNCEFSRVLGWEPAEVEQRDLAATLSGQNSGKDEGEFRKSVQAGRPFTGMLRTRRKDATPVVLEVSALPFADENGPGCVALLRDTTEDLAQGAGFQQKQRLELLGNLAGGIAHDYNNMLTAVAGFAELIIRKTDFASSTHRYALEIGKTAKRATGLTRQLLAFSSRQMIRPVPISLNRTIEEFRETVQRLLSDDIELVTDLDPAVHAARADPLQLEQIILNLVVNARDAMPEGGRLTLGTRNSSREEERRTRRTEENGGPFSVITVEDTGHGIDIDSMTRIFEPFFTTKRHGKGTGLGLATVYGIVRQSGGFVRASSEPGAGSCFEVFLPRVAEQPTVPEPELEPQHIERGSETILLAEDDAGVRELCTEVLQTEGYQVIQAEDGQAALELAAVHDGSFHLLLTDVMMPHLTGPALATRLKKLRPGLPVVFMSGYVEADVRFEESLDPRHKLLRKPLDIAEMCSTIRSALDENQESGGP